VGEVIRLSGYTELEKVRIVQKFLLPKQLDNHGLKASAVKISTAMMRMTMSFGMPNPNIASPFMARGPAW
jgi:ATP-dependent Lon protease